MSDPVHDPLERILIATDDADVAQTLYVVLCGFETDLVVPGDAQAVAEAVHKQQAQLVVLDQALGFDVPAIEALRRNCHDGLVVVVLADEGTREAYYQGRGVTIVERPYRPLQLPARFLAAYDAHRRQSAAPKAYSQPPPIA